MPLVDPNRRVGRVRSLGRVLSAENYYNEESSDENLASGLETPWQRQIDEDEASNAEESTFAEILKRATSKGSQR